MRVAAAGVGPWDRRRVLAPIRTARSRNSDAYLLGRPMASIPSRNEPCDNPVRFRVGVQNDFSEAAFTS